MTLVLRAYYVNHSPGGINMKNNGDKNEEGILVSKEAVYNPKSINQEDILDKKKSAWSSFVDSVPISKNEFKSIARDTFDSTKNYFMQAPKNDHRSAGGKIRDATISLVTSPTVAFNLANVFFCNGRALAQGFGRK